ncbi:hypothetical protein FQZ97_831080 [compost metagenome]
MVMICPSVMSWAMPRPATIRISVAMMGCMPTLATSTPFHRPHSAATPMAPRRANGKGKRLSVPATEPPIIQAATAAAMATTAPTEMSMPRVAITSVMPSETSTSGAARFTMSMRLP